MKIKWNKVENGLEMATTEIKSSCPAIACGVITNSIYRKEGDKFHTLACSQEHAMQIITKREEALKAKAESKPKPAKPKPEKKAEPKKDKGTGSRNQKVESIVEVLAKNKSCTSKELVEKTKQIKDTKEADEKLTRRMVSYLVIRNFLVKTKKDGLTVYTLSIKYGDDYKKAWELLKS